MRGFRGSRRVRREFRGQRGTFDTSTSRRDSSFRPLDVLPPLMENDPLAQLFAEMRVINPVENPLMKVVQDLVPAKIPSAATDLRYFHPEGKNRVRVRLKVANEPIDDGFQGVGGLTGLYRSLGRERTITSGASPGSKSKLSPKVAFDLEAHIKTCVDRLTRREVLFAKKLHGRGAKRQKRKRTPLSDIVCD